MMTLHQNCVKESFPNAIVAVTEEANGIPSYEQRPVRGRFLRVFPKTADDVFFLQMLDHHTQKFAPATGGGVLIQESLLPRAIIQ